MVGLGPATRAGASMKVEISAISLSPLRICVGHRCIRHWLFRASVARARDIAPHRTIAAGEPLPAIWPTETERLQPKMSPPGFLTLEIQTRWKIWTLKDTVLVRTPTRLDLIAVMN